MIADFNCNSDNFKKYKNVESKLILDFCENLEPDISIMIPTFKRPCLIKETIDSAVSQRTDKIFEVVIIDNDADGEFSEDIEALISGYSGVNIRYFRNQENIGMFGNWNRCIELARGQYLTILNDDDLLHRDWAFFVSNLDFEGAVKINFQKFSEINEINDFLCCFQSEHKKIHVVKSNELFWGNPNPGTLGLFLKKEYCMSIGGFNDKLYPNSDYDFLYRYTTCYGLLSLKNNLAFYRWAENESMKVSVLEGFVINDYLLRSSICLENDSFKRWLNKMISMCHARHVCEVNSDVRIKKIYKHIGVKDVDKVCNIFFRQPFILSLIKKMTYFLD